MTALLRPVTIGAAVTPAAGPTILSFEPGQPKSLLVTADFLYGAGGTSVDAWLQTFLGGNWIDIAQFHFLTSALSKGYNLSGNTPITTAFTPGTGVLASNTAVDGILGDALRVWWTSSGTYTGLTSLGITVSSSARLRVN